MARRPDPDYIRALKGKKPKIKPEERIGFPSTLTLIPPSYLTTDAQHHWERMTLILQPIGLIQEVGRDKLARYCQACADYEEIMEARKKLGKARIEVTKATHSKFSFWARMLEMHAGEMKDFEREYGLTPASAAKVRRPNPKGGLQTPQEKFQDYLDEIPKTH